MTIFYLAGGGEMDLKSPFLLRSSGDGFVHLDPGLGLFDLQLLVNSVEMKDVRLDLVVLCLSLQALILKKDVLLLEPDVLFFIDEVGRFCDPFLAFASILTNSVQLTVFAPGFVITSGQLTATSARSGSDRFKVLTGSAASALLPNSRAPWAVGDLS